MPGERISDQRDDMQESAALLRHLIYSVWVEHSLNRPLDVSRWMSAFRYSALTCFGSQCARIDHASPNVCRASAPSGPRIDIAWLDSRTVDSDGAFESQC